MSITEKRSLLTDYLRPDNPVFKNQHKLGETLLGPGDPNCTLCKGRGVVFDLKCTCQDNYLVQLIHYSENNKIPLERYYGERLSNYTEEQLDSIFLKEGQLMDGQTRMLVAEEMRRK